MPRLCVFLATGLGLGYLPKAPGTFGTIFGVFLFYLCRDFSFYSLLFLVFLVIFLAVYTSHQTEIILGQKDCQKIVIDEVAGVLVTFLFAPFSWVNLGLGFLLFRLFDIFKIYPANKAQTSLKGDWGVVGDDLVAGIQAGFVLKFMTFFF